nr:unnamed protein product [Callosobruchus analis]
MEKIEKCPTHKNSNNVANQINRNYEALNCTRGGGVLISVKSEYDSILLQASNNPSFEDVVKRRSFPLVLGSVYFPPGSSNLSYMDYAQTLERLRQPHKAAKILVFGDYNLPLIQWSYDCDFLIPSNLSTQTADTLISGIFRNELQQMNHISNEFGKFLDLVFADDLLDLSIAQAECPLSGVDQHHIPADGMFSIGRNPILSTCRKSVFNFIKADYSKLNKCFLEVDWTQLNHYKDVINALQWLHDVLFKSIEKCVPKKTIKSSKYPVWYTIETIDILKKKNKAYRKYKTLRSELSDLENLCGQGLSYVLCGVSAQQLWKNGYIGHVQLVTVISHFAFQYLCVWVCDIPRIDWDPSSNLAQIVPAANV